MSNDNILTIPKLNEIQENIEIKSETDNMSCVYNTKSPSAQTIFITNNYTERSPSNNSDDSIAIFSDSEVSMDEISILINNHYNELQSSTSNSPSNDDHISIKKEFSDDYNKLFCKGEDVLVMQPNNEYHVATIIETLNYECLVQHGDNLIEYCNYDKLLKFGKEEDNLLCILCKNNKSSAFIDKCCKCGRGYHMKCVKALCGIWFCKRRHKNLVKVESGIATLSLTNFSELPYDFYSLNWSINHKRNDRDIYCYCGRSGDWYKQMINCLRCKQWFHGDCIKALTNPLYCGDRFYIFVCSICNYGTEYLQRLEMKIEEVVELILFNLTVYQHKQYYDVFTVILPYARDNWYNLQLSPSMTNMSFADIRDKIIRVLFGKSLKFVSRDKTLFGLRKGIPPISPTIILPNGPMVTENFIRQQFGPDIVLLPKSPLTEYIPTDLEIKNFMTGDAYQKELSLIDDYNDSKFALEDDNIRSASNHVRSTCQKPGRKRGRKPKKRLNVFWGNNLRCRTLNEMIPPPKQFTGFNNPFVTEYVNKCSIKSTGKRSFSFGNENNKNVNRRGSDNGFLKMIPAASIDTILKSTSNINFEQIESASCTSKSSSPTEQLGSVPINLHYRKLRKRKHTTNDADKSIASKSNDVPDTCTHKNVSRIELYSYFSAAVRMASQEKAKIKGKRINEDGRVEYIIKWGNEV